MAFYRLDHDHDNRRETGRVIVNQLLYSVVCNTQGERLLKYAISPIVEKSLLYAAVHQIERGISSWTECQEKMNDLEDNIKKYVQQNSDRLSNCMECLTPESTKCNKTEIINITAMANVLKVHIKLIESTNKKRMIFIPDVVEERCGQTISIFVSEGYHQDNTNHFHSIIKVYKEKNPEETVTIKLPLFWEKLVHPLICSWNIRGCCQKEKRDLINNELLRRNIHFACLQEVNVEATLIQSKDYTWHVSKHKNNRSRGLALLIRKGLNVGISTINDQLENIQIAEVNLSIGQKPHTITIVNFHAPNNGYTKFLGDLGTGLASVKNLKKMICLGDTNAHIGRSEAQTQDNTLIGRFTGK